MSDTWNEVISCDLTPLTGQFSKRVQLHRPPILDIAVADGMYVADLLLEPPIFSTKFWDVVIHDE